MTVSGRFIRTVIVPAWAAWERSPYLRHAQRLRRTQFDPTTVVQQRQEEAALELVAYAASHSPLWRERLEEAGIDSQHITSLNEFSTLPLTTKDDFRSRGRDMLSDESGGMQVFRKTTSGSTGVSVEVFVDEAAGQFKRACTLRSDEWSGWRLGERAGMVWGNPDYRKRGWRGRLRNTLLERGTYLDTLRMNNASMTAFHDGLRRKPPSLLFGHAHSLYLFANFVRGQGGAGFRPDGIISTAMVLHDHERQLIEEVFERPVTNRYGCEEVSLIASQCEQHGGLHINADGIYLEILRPDGTPAPPGEPGRIVVTDLVNRAMPIIRYEVGDMGVLSDQQCPCGRGLPLLQRIEGRVADYVVTKRGEWISGISLTENFAVLVPGVAQVQIIQEELDRFVFRIVRGPDYGEASDAAIGSLARERFGNDVRYECEFVERIPQEPSGKYRFCISKVDKTTQEAHAHS